VREFFCLSPHVCVKRGSTSQKQAARGTEETDLATILSAFLLAHQGLRAPVSLSRTAGMVEMDCIF